MRVLVANAGSSSLKLRLLDGDDRLLAAEDLDLADAESLAGRLAVFKEVEAVGHRVVHGGREFTRATLVDDAVVTSLRRLTDLAPLHQPASLSLLDTIRRVLPSVPSVACFDTAFHATLPEAARTYALPEEWRERWGLRRFGFHGLSHAYAVRRAAALLGSRPARLVSCHLGAGASLAAIRDGESVATTMGFTPLEGLVMATRSGDVDPGLLLWLQQQGSVSTDELADALEHRSGLLGLGGSSDMRDIVTRAEAGEGRARLALATYVHRLRAGIAAMCAALNGIDALVFTGGVGENSIVVREWTVEGLAFLGMALDPGRNRESGDREIGQRGARVRTLVIASREDLEIARQTREVCA